MHFIHNKTFQYSENIYPEDRKSLIRQTLKLIVPLKVSSIYRRGKQRFWQQNTGWSFSGVFWNSISTRLKTPISSSSRLISSQIFCQINHYSFHFQSHTLAKAAAGRNCRALAVMFLPQTADTAAILMCAVLHELSRPEDWGPVKAQEKGGDGRGGEGEVN